MLQWLPIGLNLASYTIRILSIEGTVSKCISVLRHKTCADPATGGSATRQCLGEAGASWQLLAYAAGTHRLLSSVYWRRFGSGSLIRHMVHTLDVVSCRGLVGSSMRYVYMAGGQTSGSGDPARSAR